jgi:hypothetical protein
MSGDKKQPIYVSDEAITEYIQSKLQPNGFYGDFLLPLLVMRVVRNLDRIACALEKQSSPEEMEQAASNDSRNRKGD